MSNDLKCVLGDISEKLDTIVNSLDKIVKSSNTDNKLFGDFAIYYFETYRKRKVTKKTFENDISRYKKHIAPKLSDIPIGLITSEKIQAIIDGLATMPKTAHEVNSLINVIMKMAIKHGIIKHNPCDIIILPEYEKKHGKALTVAEEKRLLTNARDFRYVIIFAVALYTGLRPNEYGTAEVKNGFIEAKNSKQKDGKLHIKRIPITPKLKPYLEAWGYGVLPKMHKNSITKHFKAVLPNHKLYDMRTTFYTRCIECGVDEVARKLFMGHTLGKLGNAYIDVSDGYLINEANKLWY